jgi:hypothetical protein
MILKILSFLSFLHLLVTITDIHHYNQSALAGYNPWLKIAQQNTFQVCYKITPLKNLLSYISKKLKSSPFINASMQGYKRRLLGSILFKHKYK